MPKQTIAGLQRALEESNSLSEQRRRERNDAVDLANKLGKEKESLQLTTNSLREQNNTMSYELGKAQGKLEGYIHAVNSILGITEEETRERSANTALRESRERVERLRNRSF